MKRVLKTANRVVLLFVLLVCLYIKTYGAYGLLVEPERIVVPIQETKELLDRVEDKIEATKPKRTVIYSANILMAWDNGDGTVGSYMFTNKEFDKLQRVGQNISKDEFEHIMKIGRNTSKEVLMAMVNQRVSKLEQYASLD